MLSNRIRILFELSKQLDSIRILIKSSILFNMIRIQSNRVFHLIRLEFQSNQVIYSFEWNSIRFDWNPLYPNSIPLSTTADHI